MKKAMKGFGILLLILGVLLYFAGGKLEEAGRPVQVMTGYDAGNGFVQTGGGYMGGLTSEGKSAVTMAQGIGIAAGIGGGLILLCSFAIKEE